MIVSFVLAAVALIMTLTAAGSPDVYMKWMPSLLIAVLGILFMMQRAADERQVDDTEKHQLILTTIEDTKSTINALHEALKLPENEKTVVRIARLVVQAQQSHPFFSGIVRGKLTDLGAGLSVTAAGTYLCELEEEARLTNDILGTCTRGLKAVSYQDEGWWNSAYGSAFIKLQRERAARGLSIVRIFIMRTRDDFTDEEWVAERLSEDDLKRVEDLIQEDAKLYTATYKIPLSEVPGPYRRDFVIYDDVVLKSAEFIPGRIEKKAAFTINEALVDKAIRDFDILRQLAVQVRV